MRNLIAILTISSIICCSFTKLEKRHFEFKHPKIKNSKLIVETELNIKFKNEWQGSDYYYYGESKEGIIFSVLYYILNEEEQLSYVEAPKVALGAKYGPVFPYTYFSTYSKLKKYEINEDSWDEPTQKFMYRQCDIFQFEGIKISQKHMYAYCMFGKNVFVNIHLSKENCSASDSTIMRHLLENIKPEN